jgi:hypothetical protein
VLQPQQGKVLFEAAGRFPSISPDGSRVSYVDEDHHLVVRDLDVPKSHLLMDGWRTDGVGGWSPDSTLIIAGVQAPLSTGGRRLVVVDAVADGFAQVKPLSEEDHGNFCFWAKTSLLRKDVRS